MPKEKTSGEESPDNDVKPKTSRKKRESAKGNPGNGTDVPRDFTDDYGGEPQPERRWKKRRSHQVV